MSLQIVHWVRYYLPHAGGVETTVGLLASEQARNGHEVSVICVFGGNNSSDSELIDGVAVHRMSINEALIAADLPKFQAMLHTLRPLFNDQSVCHFHHTGAELIAHRLVHPQCHSSVLTFHSDDAVDSLQTSSPPAGDIARRANLVAVSDHVARYATSRDSTTDPSGILRDRTVTVVHGVTPTAVKKWTEPANPNQVAIVSRLTHGKGIDQAILAFANVKTQCPDATLVIAGGGEQGNDLLTLVHDNGLDDAVQFLGPQSRSVADQLMLDSLVVLVPSRVEALSMTALEAAATGRPVIATRVGGLPEVVVHNRTGIVVDPGDHNALADAMVDLLTTPQRAAHLGKQALADATAKPNIGNWADLYTQIYTAQAS